MLAKWKKKQTKENVKSCIIYEICIKDKCNSIINKILIQFLEPVVPVRGFVVIYLKFSRYLQRAASKALSEFAEFPLASVFSHM